MTSGNTTEPHETEPQGTERNGEPTPPAGRKPDKAKTVKPAKQQQAGVVPKKAAEDDPRTWGDSDSDNDHDAWLKEQKPPHWG